MLFSVLIIRAGEVHIIGIVEYRLQRALCRVITKAAAHKPARNALLTLVFFKRGKLSIEFFRHGKRIFLLRLGRYSLKRGIYNIL